jgi:hypothetical protein
MRLFGLLCIPVGILQDRRGRKFVLALLYITWTAALSFKCAGA